MTKQSKGGRPATGSIKWRKNVETGKPQWYVRLTLADGSRSPFIALNPNILHEDIAGARAGAREVSDEARESGILPDTVRETVAEWFTRFHDHKEARGLSSVDDMRGRVANWVLPTIGHKGMRAVTPEDIKAIVRRLDRAMLAWQEADGERGEGRASAGTVANVWGDLVHAFDEAVRAKDEGLHALTVSPCADVRGPETGAARDGPVLYSDEIVALVRGKAVDDAVSDVPLHRRHVWAMAVYTMTRRSELAALTAADVDLAHATITISKQVERDKKKRKATGKATKRTKTGRTRTVDIEPNVYALVEQLVAKPEGKGGRLLRVPPAEDYAELLRKDLWTVGARAERLHTEDATRTKMTGHCLRDTGLTHMAVRGDNPIVIQWRGGHTDFKTTQGYIDRGRVEARRIGDPLPPLPPELFTSAQRVSDRVSELDETSPATMRESLSFLRPQRELKKTISRMKSYALQSRIWLDLR